MIVVIVCLLLICQTPAAAAAAAAGDPLPGLSAYAAVLIDARTGVVLYGRRADQLLPPASTTKMITALLGLQLGRLQEIAKVSPYAASTPGTSLHLKAGERFRLIDLIRGALMVSGNDAATVIAEQIGGREAFFAGLMTYKNRTLGGLSSHFTNPHGLSDNRHLSTAYDLAMVARYALTNREFSRIVSTGQDRIRDLKGATIDLYTTNRLLGSKQDGYTVIGVKTGTTDQAGQCLVAAARSGDRLLISVVLHSGDRYGDTKQLLSYGFQSCRTLRIAIRGQSCFTLPGSNGKKIRLYPERDLVLVLPKSDLPALEKRLLLAPKIGRIPAGDKAGELTVLLHDHLLCSTGLVCGQGS
jgi:D-alanyl-D-alanine carboxypeptidase (penicillin-binding protein 5/6)